MHRKHNRTFAVEPQAAESAYRSLPAETDLEYVFAIRTFRQIGSGQPLSNGGKLYTLAEKPSQLFETKTTMKVRETMQGKLDMWHKGQALELREIQKSLLYGIEYVLAKAHIRTMLHQHYNRRKV